MKAGRPRVLIEEHVLPGDQHVVEDHQGVDLVEPAGERIVARRRAAGETGAADVLDARRVHLDDAAKRIFGELRIAPVGDGGLEEGLIGVGRRGLVFGAADDDAGIGLLDHMHQHVGVLVLRDAWNGRPWDRYWPKRGRGRL